MRLAVIGVQAGHAMTVAGFMLTLAAASMWGMGNVITKRMGKVDLLSLVVWASLVPPLPFLALSLIVEGPAASRPVCRHIPHVGPGDRLSRVYCDDAELLRCGEAAGALSGESGRAVSLLVPIVGLASAALLLDEGLSPIQFVGAVLVMAGLMVNVFGGW